MVIGGFATLTQLLQQAAAAFRDRPCLGMAAAEHTTWWSYADLERQVQRAAAWLRAQGIAPGDRVALWGANRPQWVAGYFGCLAVGGVVVPLDAKSHPDFVRRVLERTEARLLVLGSPQHTSLGQTVVPTAPLETLDDLLPAEGVTPVAVQPDDLAEIVFTSGTTGTPKGVMLTHRNIASNVQQAAQVIPPPPDTKLLSILPLSHMFEQTVGLLVPLTGGASIVYLPGFQPDLLFRTLERERITAMLCVPYVLDRLRQGIEREVERQGKGSQWELLHRIAPWLPFPVRRLLFRPVHRRLGGRFDFFLVGGAALDPDLARRWENLGIKVVQGYGTTETSPIIAGQTLQRRHPDSAGRPMPGGEVRIAEDGEVLVRGPNVFQGYWQAPDLTQEAFTEGWYHTGDLGFLDARGELHLRGRKKEVIVLPTGLNVYPEDVEQELTKEPAIAGAAVVGRARGRGEVEIHAVLLMEHNDPTAAEAAVRAANRRLARHQQIRGFTIWPDADFPRTPAMKPKRREIAAALERLQPTREVA
ncbi:MAG: AMP-binding protein [Chloroflexi bacterium]|nr:AMP-binding protein [Chloroflexota bacterium]